MVLGFITDAFELGILGEDFMKKKPNQLINK
jgi:hypothetical protein